MTVLLESVQKKKIIRLSLAILFSPPSFSHYQKMLLCKMAKREKDRKKERKKEVISFSILPPPPFFDRKWNNWNPLRLIT